MKKYTVLVAIVFALIVSLIIAYRVVKKPFEKEYSEFASIKVGMKENDVIGLLSPPTHVYKSSDAPMDYYVKGYSHKKRGISSKVLIYVGKEPILYVYLDNQLTVEDVFVGGS